MKTVHVTWQVVPIALALCSCGGSQAEAPGASSPNAVREHTSTGPTQPVSKRGDGSVTAKLGPGGGSLELSEGPRVVVPAGAVEGGQEFVLKVSGKTSAFSNKENERALGPTFSFSPPLDADIEVSFPLTSLPAGWGDPSLAYEYEEGAAIGYGEDSTRTKWQYERAPLANGRITAKLPRATGLRYQFVLSNLEAQ